MGIQKEFKVRLDNKKTYTTRVETYSSAMEVVQDCKTRKLTGNYDDVADKNFRKSWEGVESYEEALDLLRNGYQPTVEQLTVIFKRNGAGSQKRIQFENQVYGFAPIVPLAIKGVPQSMINMTMKPIKCKVVDIYYDMGVPSYTEPEQVISAGQKLLSTIISLEKQGYRFNLYALQGFSGDRSADILCIKVKSSDKPIDLKRISFPLTHPAFFRVIGFDWQGKNTKAEYRSGRGRALSHSLNDTEIKQVAKQAFGDNAIYISCNSIINKDENHIKEVLTA